MPCQSLFSYVRILALTWSLQQYCEAGQINVPTTRWGNGHSEATGLAVSRGSVQTRVAGPWGVGVWLHYHTHRRTGTWAHFSSLPSHKMHCFSVLTTTVVGRTAPSTPKIPTPWSPEPVNTWPRASADLIQLQVLRWREHPGLLSMWVQRHHKRTGKGRGGRRVRSREGDGMAESEVGVMWLLALKMKEQEPRNAGSL